MKTILYQCDICKNEIQGEMSLYLFNDTLMTVDFQQVPVKKEGHYCKECTGKITNAIQNIYDETIKQSPQNVIREGGKVQEREEAGKL